MAMEDGFVLAQELQRHDTPAEAFQSYYSRRIGRVSRVQQVSAQNAAQFHVRSPVAQAITYGPMAAAHWIYPPALRLRSDWIYREEFGPLGV